jgi:pyruvate/2-oxoglutarate dehydrogenase complex dihydrolipoamide acyltransferase (E2) component
VLFELKMPEVGPGVTEATIVNWRKQIGDPIQEKEILVEVMTEKVNMEVECPVSGKVAEILYPKEAAVRVNEVIARVETNHA